MQIDVIDNSDNSSFHDLGKPGQILILKFPQVTVMQI